MLQKMKKNQTARKKSIKVTLIIIMLLVAIVPLSVAVTISSISSISKAQEDAEDTLEYQAEFLKSSVYSEILKAQVALNTFAASPSTIAYMKGEAVDPALLKKQMGEINEHFEDNNAVVLSNTSGMMVLRSDDSKLVDISERDYFQSALSGEVCVSSVLVSASTNERNFCIAVPVKDNTSNQILGVVHRSYNLNNFHELLASSKTESFIVANDGILAAHANYEIAADDEPVDFSQSPYMTSGKDSDTYFSTATGVKSIVSYIKEPISGYTVCVAKNYSEVTKESRKSALTIIMVGVLMLIVVLIVSVVMSNSFIKPIKEVDHLLARLAEGKFVRIHKYGQREDEFGEMIRNSNSVIDKLQSIVEEIKSSSNTVGESSSELSAMASQISATTETVAEAIQEIAQGASEQAKDVQNSAENTGFITDAIENVQVSTNELNELAIRMKTASEVSSDSLQNLQDSNVEMAEKIEEIAEKIAGTQKAVSDINEHVEGISGIAAQTNLLSLNATIEAARAGDAGKGFAVVAEEIRKLADDSETLASEIQKVMDVLLKQAEIAVEAAQAIIEESEMQQRALGETMTSVQGMIRDVEVTAESVGKISGEADVCVSSNKEVSNAMSSLSAISEENAAATETTGASVEELSATVITLADSANDLKNVAEKLNEEIAFFQ